MEFEVLVHSAIHPATGMYPKSFQTKPQLHAFFLLTFSLITCLLCLSTKFVSIL